MTYYESSHWSVGKMHHGLLLFAQAFEEMLATHSHDSYKVPVLNFHYICYETLNVIELVEDNVLDRGNLIPLVAEIRSLFDQDEIARKILGSDFDALFSKKNSKGEYDRVPLKADTGKEVEQNISNLKKAMRYITAELERNNQYYKLLIAELKSKILEAEKDMLKLDEIYSLTRTIASELINKGFNQTYIYDCIKACFFNSENIVDSIDVLDRFFDNFDLRKKEYVVYLPINGLKQKKALEEYGGFQIADNVFEMFDSSIPYILKYKCKEIDPYGARESILRLINFCLSVSHFIKHNKYDYNPKYSEIINVSSGAIYFIKRPEQAIVCGYGNCEELQVGELLDTCLNMQQNLFQVLQLHSSALISKNSENQLINLWTAVEVAIPVIRKDDLSRINQISNVLSTALCDNYFSILVEQLHHDIKLVCEDAIAKFEGVGINEDIKGKIIATIVLPENATTYTDILTLLIDRAPILACKMHHYKVLWADAKAISTAYKNHAIRLSQQIMRIYRTRNMLVHDGSSMPYSDYVLQNLHYYIDTYIGFLYKYHKMGYRSVQSIIDASYLKEQQYLTLLKSSPTIKKENIHELILRE